METATTLKIEYNKALQRWDKATEYLENPERTPKEINQWLSEYEAILKQRQALCMEIWKETGIKPTIEQFEEGFFQTLARNLEKNKG